MGSYEGITDVQGLPPQVTATPAERSGKQAEEVPPEVTRPDVLVVASLELRKFGFKMMKLSKARTNISFFKVARRAALQIENNPKINQYLSMIIDSPGSRCSGMTLSDFVTKSGRVTVPVYVMDGPPLLKVIGGGKGQTRWDGVLLARWTGQPNRSIALDAKSVFASGSERDAAGLLVHEFTHWLTAHCLRKPESPQWRGRQIEGGSDEGEKVRRMVDWSILGAGGSP